MYKNKKDGINAVNDLFNAMTTLSGITVSQLCTFNMKEEFHYNEFKKKEDEKIIARIEDILINGYHMNKELVENEFEKLYFEFQFSNGKRVIGTKIENNIFSLLFLDPNHLICKQSSRNVKEKEKYSIQGAFQKWNEYETKDNINTEEISDYLKMIIENYKNNTYQDKEQLINDLNYIAESLLFNN